MSPRQDREQRRAKQPGQQGATDPGRHAWSESERRNPLDVPDSVYGRNPRELSQAVRRSVERTGMTTVGGVHATAASRARTRSNARGTSSTERTRVTAADGDPAQRHDTTAAPARKGGPGKHRPTPRHTRKR